MIDKGSILKYDKGTYSVLEGESVFDLHPNLSVDSQYCKTQNAYFTPKGKLNHAQLDVLNEMQNEKLGKKNFFEKIYDKFKEIKEKIISLFK